MIKNYNWIGCEPTRAKGYTPLFVKEFCLEKLPKKAVIEITCKGVYYATLNGKRIGDFIMAPGYTQYEARLQYQTYDITELLQKGQNELHIYIGRGWYAGRIREWNALWSPHIIAGLCFEYGDGKSVCFGTDESWLMGDGKILFSEIYDGEVYDAGKEISNLTPVTVYPDEIKDEIIEQEGEIVREMERFSARKIIKTPKGETVIDFGQNLVGYPVFTVDAKAGEKISLSFGEVLDKDGNFYNENYRSAECNYIYTCTDGVQCYTPHLTFYGYRYVRVDEFPASCTLTKDTFTSVAVYSDMKRTGHISCSNPKLNQLFSNIFWGQKSNFLDIPTDCPQRDERQGWTGDAQIFCKAASLNYNVYKFFKKWIRDMREYQLIHGYVGWIIPAKSASPMSGAWSDAAVMVPWQIYLTYGDKEFLRECIPLMVDHVKKVAQESEVQYAWRGGSNLRQFGDWLASDSLDRDKDGSFVHTGHSGATNPNFLQSAFYANDVRIIADALDVLGEDSSYYRDLHSKIVEKFREDFPEYFTQTECAFALRWNLTPDRESTKKQLEEIIHANGDRMSTGLVGTPHILHALSESGLYDLAYTLLLQEKLPSWLYSVNLGATTMWEHWDGIDEEGNMWSTTMNSFNHYSYGAVADWIYEVAAGIGQEKSSAGYEMPVIAPHPDKRLGWLEASLETKHGKIHSKWTHTLEGSTKYEISVPVKSKIVIGEKQYTVDKGTYVFFE